MSRVEAGTPGVIHAEEFAAGEVEGGVPKARVEVSVTGIAQDLWLQA
jgi:hypothetical protein